MNPDKQAPTSTTHQPQLAYEDEISLIDIYLTIKRNSKLFFGVILLSFFISIFVSYYIYQANDKKEIVSGFQGSTTEYTLWIEVGKIYGTGLRIHKNQIEHPAHTIEKINNIYIPKLAESLKTKGSGNNQLLVSVKQHKRTNLLVLKAIKTSDTVDYNKILLTLASYILVDHNEGLTSNGKAFVIQPTRIIQETTKRIYKSKSKKKSIKKNIMIPVLGLILGIFLGVFAVFLSEFFKKVKEAETSS